MNDRSPIVFVWLMVLLAMLGCDRQASRLASEHGLRYTGSPRERVQYMNTAIDLDPDNTMAYIARGNSYMLLGSYEQAVNDLKRGIELDTLHEYPIDTYNNLGWLLATCTDDKIRNGEEAVKYATQACEQTQWENGNIIDTLAAAYAETGNFSLAIKWQQKAMELGDMSDRFIRVGFERRLEMYQNQEAYRE